MRRNGKRRKEMEQRMVAASSSKRSKFTDSTSPMRGRGSNAFFVLFAVHVSSWLWLRFWLQTRFGHGCRNYYSICWCCCDRISTVAIIDVYCGGGGCNTPSGRYNLVLLLVWIVLLVPLSLNVGVVRGIFILLGLTTMILSYCFFLLQTTTILWLTTILLPQYWCPYKSL